MNVVYDTSSLIALFLEDHPDHEKSIRSYLKLIDNDSDFYICTHSVAEIFSNITRGIRYFNYSAGQANDLIQRDLQELFSVVDLQNDDYLTAINFLEKENLTGAIIYDAIIVQSAAKIGAEYIVTLNGKDFKRLGGLTNADFIIPS